MPRNQMKQKPCSPKLEAHLRQHSVCLGCAVSPRIFGFVARDRPQGVPVTSATTVHLCDPFVISGESTYSYALDDEGIGGVMGKPDSEG